MLPLPPGGATTLCSKVLSSLTAAAAADFWQESIVPRPLQPRRRIRRPSPLHHNRMQAPAGLGLGLGLRAAPTIEPYRTQGLQWLFAHAPMNTLVCLLGAAVLAAALLHRISATRRPLPNPPAAVGAGRLRPPWPVNPDKDGQAEEQLLQVEFALNDMLRHCAPSRRQKVGADFVQAL